MNEAARSHSNDGTVLFIRWRHGAGSVLGAFVWCLLRSPSSPWDKLWCWFMHPLAKVGMTQDKTEISILLLPRLPFSSPSSTPKLPCIPVLFPTWQPFPSFVSGTGQFCAKSTRQEPLEKSLSSLGPHSLLRDSVYESLGDLDILCNLFTSLPWEI